MPRPRRRCSRRFAVTCRRRPLMQRDILGRISLAAAPPDALLARYPLLGSSGDRRIPAIDSHGLALTPHTRTTEKKSPRRPPPTPWWQAGRSQSL